MRTRTRASVDLPQPELADEPHRLALGHVEIDAVDRAHDAGRAEKPGAGEREVLDDPARLEQPRAARERRLDAVIEGLGLRFRLRR